MTYIDANVFIFAASDKSHVGTGARKIIAAIQHGSLPASTCTLTYDEVVWGVRKMLTPDDGIVAGELLLQLTHLNIKEVRRETIVEAHHLMKHFNLKPRDAIHLASMRLEGETEIISEDPDFDSITGITRIPIMKYKNTPET